MTSIYFQIKNILYSEKTGDKIVIIPNLKTIIIIKKLNIFLPWINHNIFQIYSHNQDFKTAIYNQRFNVNVENRMTSRLWRFFSYFTFCHN